MENSLDRRRRITPQAGRALVILSHAIEYLADEFVQGGDQLSALDGRVQAMQLLKALNRQIYCECPVALTFAERIQALLSKIWPAGSSRGE
jgi:hypothetical protein